MKQYISQFINFIKRRLEYVFYAGFGLLTMASILIVYWPENQTENFNTFIPQQKVNIALKDGTTFGLVKVYGVGKIKKPVSVFVDDKRLYISDSETNHVVVLTRTGRTLAVISKADYPYGVAPFGADKILLADSGGQKVIVLKRDSAFVRVLDIKGGTVLKPGYMLAYANNIFIADLAGHDIKKLDNKGNIIGSIATPLNGHSLLKYPQGMDIDKAGNLWVADGGNERIICFDQKGNYLKSFNGSENGGNSFAMVKGLAIIAQRYLCVSDPITNIVRVFDIQDGIKEIGKIGGAGNDLGKFIHPMGLYVDEYDHLFVADRGNGRIQEFTIR